MQMKEEINMGFDFEWIFTGGADSPEDDFKYREFLKEIYKRRTSSVLLLKKEEVELLRNYLMRIKRNN